MNWLSQCLAAAATTVLGCALPPAVETSNVAVWARSHNRSTIHVYLLCGDKDALWLGAVAPNESEALEFPNTQTRCPRGLNFFLVKDDGGRGYWVGPMYIEAGSSIVLVIEKYAGLSSVSLSRQ
jgi:hypothetical protein